MSILNEIISNKKKEVELRKKLFSHQPIGKNLHSLSRKTYSLANKLKNSRSGIIAEHKRRSPSQI